MKGPCVSAQRSARESLTERVGVLRKHVKAASAHNVDGIHDLRVASRRLRAALSDASGRFHKRALKPFRKRVREVTRGLGTARELDVSIELLYEIRESEGKVVHGIIARTLRMLRELRDDESKSVDNCCALIRAKSFSAEVDALLAANNGSSKCHRKATRAALRRRYKTLCDAYHNWTKTATNEFDESLHAVRIALKKLRYTCEIASPLYDDKMSEFIERVKRAQESLGDWNDLRILREYALTCAQKGDGMQTEFAVLDRAFRKRALMDLGKFVKAAPDLFEKTAIAATNRLFAKQKVQCCIRRNPKSDITHA